MIFMGPQRIFRTNQRYRRKMKMVNELVDEKARKKAWIWSKSNAHEKWKWRRRAKHSIFTLTSHAWHSFDHQKCRFWSKAGLNRIGWKWRNNLSKIDWTSREMIFWLSRKSILAVYFVIFNFATDTKSETFWKIRKSFTGPQVACHGLNRGGFFSTPPKKLVVPSSASPNKEN